MRRRRRGLRARLLVADLGLIMASALTVVVVTLGAAPALFEDHLRRAGETDPLVVAHAQEAFVTSLFIGVGTALVVSALAAAAVALITSRRLSAPFSELARAADQVAGGRFDVSVPDPRIGAEAEDLAQSFRTMAGRLAETDAVRRRQQNDLAHELRSPLSTLIAHVEALQDGVIDADPATLATLRSQLDRMNRLVTDLQTLAAAEEHALALHSCAVDLVGEVAHAVGAVEPVAQRRDVMVAVAATDGPVEGVTDRARLAQILGNLLDNAMRHTPSGGEVMVRTSRQGDVATVAVTDTGEGFTGDELAHAFDRLYRGDPSRRHHDGQGSGLGLTISRALAREMGGDLTAASDGPGRGATLTLTLSAGPVVGAASVRTAGGLPNR